ncbi:MAG: hypothetical protein ACTSRF_10625 [Candidatus Freyarchaeota archaeon]
MFQSYRLSLREWFMLILFFLALHNSVLSLSWLLGRSYMTVFKALRRLVLRIGGELQPVRMSGGVECDEVYVTPRVSREGTTASASDGLVGSLGVGA